MEILLHQITDVQKDLLVDRIANDVTYRMIAPAITRIELFLTENCTLNCDYCFVATRKSGKRMNWKTASLAIDFLMDYSENEPDILIIFFGGEPLMEFPLMKRIAKYADMRADKLGKRVNYALTTNGTIISKDILAFAQQKKFNYLLSLDGDKDIHDRHRRTSNGQGSWNIVTGEHLQLMKNIQGWIGARLTVNPDTVYYLSSGVQTLFNLGVNQFLIGPNEDVEWTSEQLEMYASEMEKVAKYYLCKLEINAPIRIIDFEETTDELYMKYSNIWGCEAGRTKVAVSTEGDIYPCAKFVSPFPSMKGSYRLGSVYDGITNKSSRLDFMDNRDESRSECSICSYNKFCGGGCPAVNLHMRNSIFLPNSIGCFMTRTKVDLLSRTELAKLTQGTKISEKHPLSRNDG